MSGSLVALSLFAQAAFAWLFPYITPEIMVSDLGGGVALSLFAQAAFAWLFPYITPKIMVSDSGWGEGENCDDYLYSKKTCANSKEYRTCHKPLKNKVWVIYTLGTNIKVKK